MSAKTNTHGVKVVKSAGSPQQLGCLLVFSVAKAVGCGQRRSLGAVIVDAMYLFLVGPALLSSS